MRQLTCPTDRRPASRRRWLRTAVFAALVGASGGALAEPVTYALDPVHTRVMFAVEHAGFSKAIGTVSGSTGILVFDADDWLAARLEAQVPLTRLDLGDDKWNKATLARNLLDAGDHPLASFVSTRVEPVDATHAAVFGMLTLRGVSQEVKLDVTLNALKRHPLPPFRRTAGFSATTTISRKAFGMTAWPTVIGDQVELRIEAEATRARGETDADADAAAEPGMPATAAATGEAASTQPVEAATQPTPEAVDAAAEDPADPSDPDPDAPPEPTP